MTAASLKSYAFYAVVLLAALIMGFAFARLQYNFAGGLLILLVVAIAAFLLIKKMKKAEPASWFVGLLIAGVAAKIGVALFRMWMTINIYGGLFDAARYFNTGIQLSQAMRTMEWSAVLPRLQFQSNWGTRYTEFYSGLAQVLVGPTTIGLYIIWAFLGFIGCYFFYRAFCIAFPFGNRLLYGVIAFFLPSVMFWANGLGKDALMSLFIGLTAYGAARVLNGEHLKSILPLGVGLFGAFTVRPHMVGLLGVSLLLAMVMGNRRALIRSPIRLALVGVIVFGLFWWVIPVGAKYAGLEEANLSSAQNFIEFRQSDRFQGGGSAFKPPSLTNPVELPLVWLTVSVRPFPWEAHNAQALIQAVNGVLIVALVLWKFRRVVQAIRSSLDHPYILFILCYFIFFGPMFITIPNFGTLSREQAMLHPFLLMLVAYQPAPKPRAPVPSRQEIRPGLMPLSARG